MAPNEKLKAWIARENISNAEAARRAGYDRGNFHRIIKGCAKPSLELAGQIDAMTGGAVPMTDWVGFEPQQVAA